MSLSTFEIAKRTQRIRAIYREFLNKLLPLRKEQDEIYRAYAEKLEQKKVEGIRERIEMK